MANALNVVANVHEGFWTDWSRGGVLGLTLTLNPTASSILTNSLTLFITVCGIQFWTIVRYAIHQRGTVSFGITPTPHLERQQRILRNATSAPSTARLMFELAWTCRRSNGRRALRAYMIGTAALIYTLAFSVAVLFASQVVSAKTPQGGSLVLLTNKTICGPANMSYFATMTPKNIATSAGFDLLTTYQNKSATEAQLSLQYSQECYRRQTVDQETVSPCRILKKPFLGWNSTSSTICPFDKSLCSDSTQTVSLDTGYIDTHEDLGVNARPEDRLKFRKVTKCTVLNDTGYLEGWNNTITSTFAAKPAAEMVRLFYGRNFAHNTNWTYSHTNFASFYSNFTSLFTVPYQLAIQRAFAPAEPAYSSSDFDPIPEFKMKDQSADLNLLFLSFTGLYLQAVEDPWFSANTELSFSTGPGYARKRYARDQTVSTMACLEQHSFCTDKGICTPLQGYDQVQNNADFNVALSKRQQVLLDRLLWAADWSRLWWVIQQLSRTTTPVSASPQSFAGNSGAIIAQTPAHNQWKSELEFWHSVGMAHFQRLMLQWATGQVASQNSPLNQPLLQAVEPSDKWFCNAFTIHSTYYHSFSVLSLVLVIVFGLITIFISMSIEQLTEKLRNCFRGHATDKSWNRDHLFTLQRIRTVMRKSSPPTKMDLGLIGIEGSQSPRPRCPPSPGLGLSQHRTTPGRQSRSNTTFSFIKTPSLADDIHDTQPRSASNYERPKSWLPISLHDSAAPFGHVQDHANHLYEQERQKHIGLPLHPRQAGPVPPARLVADLHSRALYRRGLI